MFVGRPVPQRRSDSRSAVPRWANRRQPQRQSELERGGAELLFQVPSVTAFAVSSAKARWRTTPTTANFPEAVRENEEVVPVNMPTWVLSSGVTVGR
jgi:hypothetical protein